jgi:hypothetical protein
MVDGRVKVGLRVAVVEYAGDGRSSSSQRRTPGGF